MSDSPKGASNPFPLAILICDSVYIDERSKKKVLVGIFDNINATEFPTEYKPLAIYARLIDAEGEYSFRFDYVQVKDDKLLGKASIPSVTIPDRLKVYDLVIEPPPIPLPEPGEYEFRLFANDRYIGRVKFNAVKIEPGKSG